METENSVENRAGGTRTQGARKNPAFANVEAKRAGSKAGFGVRWTQAGHTEATTSRDICFATVAEAEDLCRKVNAKYREITQWPVRLTETREVVEEYPAPGRLVA